MDPQGREANVFLGDELDFGCEDDFDEEGVVYRRHSARLLADGGDGAEADLMGTTPPRTTRRNKDKRRTYIDSVQARRYSGGVAKAFTDKKNPESPVSERFSVRKRESYRQRAMEREWKQDATSEDMAPIAPTPAIPTLVESCNRFMCLSSRLKSRAPLAPRTADVPTAPPDDNRADDDDDAEQGGGGDGDAPPPSRVNFHNTFSMLINMGNIDKGCRRAISREEKVWQNELKDLIWLELQARLAGRTAPQHDAVLVRQRGLVPAVLSDIRHYRFVNNTPCKGRGKVGPGDSQGNSARDGEGELGVTEDDLKYGCLSLNCRECSEAIGQAMREVGALLDSYYGAATLYPSTAAMTADHPLIATRHFKTRLKAMCLWYNQALHMRMRLVGVRLYMRRLLQTAGRRDPHGAHTASDSDVSRQSSEIHRPCTVKFNVSNTPTDSNNSDSSAQSEQQIDQKAIDQRTSQPSDQHSTDQQSSAQQSAEQQSTDQQSTDQRSYDRQTSEQQKCEEENENRDLSRNKEELKIDLAGEEKNGDRSDGDSGIDRRSGVSGQTTPEIVIDSRYGTADPVTSQVSQCDWSEPYDAYDLGPLDDLTNLRVLGKCRVSPFRTGHYEMLKTQGVRRCMMFMDRMRTKLLNKIYLTFERPHQYSEESTDPVNEFENIHSEVFDETATGEGEREGEEGNDAYEMRRYGGWSEETLSMQLPSYRSHFLLLGCICIEAVHDYLEMRREARPNNPSCLTVKQLIHELKEGLDIATRMRCTFARSVSSALQGRSSDAAVPGELMLPLNTFDDTVVTVFKQYLSYVLLVSSVEQMSRTALQAEWAFTSSVARRLAPAAQLAPKAFAEIACNQLDRVTKQFSEKLKALEEASDNTSEDADKHIVYALCREAQSIFASEREAALHAAHWARSLAARLHSAPHRAHRAHILESLMSLRDCVVSAASLIDEHAAPESDAVAARVRELLLQVYRLGFELHKELYKSAAPPASAWRRPRPSSLQPPAPARHSDGDVTKGRRRPETMLVHDTYNPFIHKELHRFVTSQSQRRRGVTSPPRRGLGSDDVFDDRLFDNISQLDTQSQSSFELLLPPVSAPPTCTVTSQERAWGERVARAVVQFARCWMRFVLRRAEPGRGLRPRWASQGLEFLMLACDPCNTKYLSDEEFEELKKQMDGCISHVIGKRLAPVRVDKSSPTWDDRERRRRLSPAPRPPPIHPAPPAAGREEPPTPPTPPCDQDPLLTFHTLENREHNTRVLEAVRAVDAARDSKLRSMKAVGRVLEAAVSSYEPKLRQLKFKWQRGLKIGAGTFGKVYTVVNTESGQLLAMKEISIALGDRRALQRAANELRVLEGVAHPHLVRYYGCELHREEMLLFMELCVEGSLEALIATSAPGGLGEPTVRRYTKQLVSAVMELHARGIAHRDIKSGNIFLTNEGHCLKLGDFGCAVKIRAQTTAAGELQGHVGTQAYMAPEIFMKSSGHGRKADVWSLGCVVTEMASGKRPFCECDSNYQIMFVVGMGGSPHVPPPPQLSAEGGAFCRAALTRDPDDRPSADTLSLHHFLMVKSDEDCNCEPAYLMA